MLFLFPSLFKLSLSLFQSLFLRFNLLIKAVNVLFKLADKALNAESFFAGKLALFYLADKIFQLAAGMNKKIVHFLLLAALKLMLLAAKFNFLFAKLKRFFFRRLHFPAGRLLQPVKLKMLFIKAAHKSRNISLLGCNIISGRRTNLAGQSRFLGNIKGVTFARNAHQKAVGRRQGICIKLNAGVYA